MTEYRRDGSTDTIFKKEQSGQWVPIDSAGSDNSPIVPYQQVLSQQDTDAVGALQQASASAMSHAAPPMAHSPTEHADAALIYSKAYMGVMVLVVSAIVGVAYLFQALGESMGIYVITWIGGFGVTGLAVLYANRKQGLLHSSTGVHHHEISSRERVAMHAIDTHADLLRGKWGAGHE